MFTYFTLAVAWTFFLPALREDTRALVRLQADAVNRSLVPAFYRYLQAQYESASRFLQTSHLRCDYLPAFRHAIMPHC